MRKLVGLGLVLILATACGKNGEEKAEISVKDQVEQAADAQGVENSDPHLWLEEVEGEEALTWVEEQNNRTLAALKKDPRFRKNYDKALAALVSDARIPYGSIRLGNVYNFWQDDTHPKGLWRRTSIDGYSTDDPVWETILDIDALAKAEDKNWVFKGVDCFLGKIGPDATAPSFYRCIMRLSDGGKDAVVLREFDMVSKSFVEDEGFITPEAKQGATWLDENTLLLGTDWGNDGSTVTESGYPSVTKLWTRGTPLEEAAPYFSGETSDVGTWPNYVKLTDGTRRGGVVQAKTFYKSNYLFSTDDGSLTALPVPERSELSGIYKDQLLISLKEDWVYSETDVFKTGDLISVDFTHFLATKSLKTPGIIFRPNDRQAITGIGITKNGVLMSLNDNVVGKVLRLVPNAAGWSAVPVQLPGQGQADISFSDSDEALAYITYEGFLTPESLLQFDSASNETTVIKSLPEKFDASDLEVTQNFASSTDGTQIPYFLVHKKGMVKNGKTPTILYGYGGFEITISPSYSETRGKLWLEQGGAYVIANIRGGGEFGPNWHQAGLKTKRQIIYDDFVSVAEDLIEQRITSPDKLGIVGRSNGGLLMGVMITQRPDLWKAVDIGVPLLDMLRYHKLLAGASWVAEYGSPEIEEEAAFLKSISPYHNFDATTDYPIPFFYTSTKDDRVHPGHARKFAKLFEEAGKPFYYYENLDGGHAGAAKPETMALRIALEYTYFANQLIGEN